LYLCYNFLYNNIFPFQEEFDLELNKFKENYVSYLSKELYVSYDLTFFLKNFNKEKFIPIKVKKHKYNHQKLSIFDLNKKDNSFKTFLTKRYSFQQEFFETLLSTIELYYKEHRKPNEEFRAFMRAVCSALETGGPIQKKIFMVSFFREHFSFERGIFRERNLESFSTKDSLIFISNYYKVNRIIEDIPYKIKKEYFKQSSFAKFFIKYFSTFIKHYNKCFSFHNTLKNIHLYHMKNFDKLKSVKQNFLFYKMFDHTTLFFKNKLILPKEYLTDNVYFLHFLLINNYLPEINVFKSYNRKHPIIYLKHDFDLLSYTIPELDLISKFLSLSIKYRFKNSYDENNNYLFSLLNLLSLNKKLGLFLINYFFENQKISISHINKISEVIISKKLFDLKNYHLKFYFHDFNYFKFSLSFIYQFKYRELNNDFISLIKNKLKLEYDSKKLKSYHSTKLKNSFVSLKFNFFAKEIYYMKYKRLNSFKEELFYLHFFRLIENNYNVRNILIASSFLKYVLIINIYFIVFSFLYFKYQKEYDFHNKLSMLVNLAEIDLLNAYRYLNNKDLDIDLKINYFINL